MENTNKFSGHQAAPEKILLSGLRENINKYEWTKELDNFLHQSVIRNYFNFDLVSLEVQEESKNLHLNLGATHVFTNEKCRLRWSYIHLKRKEGKQIRYKLTQPNKQIENQQLHNIQTTNTQNKSVPTSSAKAYLKSSSTSRNDPQQLLQNKQLDGLTKIIQPKSMGDIEKQVWKHNITHETRNNKDYLDVSKEDFSKNQTLSIEGKTITPSNFNIFRDSLRQTSQQLLKTLNDNLPEMNLKEIDQQESNEDSDGDVLPLDFRTAMIEEDNKVVIQAKPLQFKTDQEIQQDLKKAQSQFDTTDSYLEAVKKESFKDDNVILIDPDINIKEKFEEIDLLCNLENRINNTVDAPVKPADQRGHNTRILKPIKPQSAKQYDTDTENEESKEPIKKDNLDFNNILKQCGISDINRLIGASSGDERNIKKEESKTKDQNQISSQQNTKTQGNNEKSAQQRVNLIASIMQENRQAQMDTQNKNYMSQSINQLMANLQNITKEEGEDSDIAPMSALVDLPSEEEEKQQQNKIIQKSVHFAQSASEDERSDKEKVQSEGEQINTSSKTGSKQSKVVSYKGVRIQSEDEKSKSSSSDSGQEDFNLQRKQIRQKLLGAKNPEFDKNDILQQNQSDAEQRKWDDDMQDFDNLMKDSISEAQLIQEQEAQKARDEVERLRHQKLRQQEQFVKDEQEKKNREREELMERLKRQDEERKRRKKDEKDRKEKEKELQRRIEEEKRQREEEQKEKEQEILKKKKREEERQLKEKDESNRRKKNFEFSIRKTWNGSDIPCLFDEKIAYSHLLNTLPNSLENKIIHGEVSNEDLIFRRYKTLIVPTDGLFQGQALIEIINYFMRYSTINTVDNNLEHEHLRKFPFKCIGLTMTMAMPPFNKPSLAAVQNNNQQAYRVLTLLFDTHDAPLTKINFTDTLKQIKVSEIISDISLESISKNYKSFIEKLAFDYFQLNKIKEFPYQVKTERSPLLTFDNDQDLVLDPHDTLHKIVFFTEYTVQDDVAPMSTKESWELLRRYPTFYAYNPNNKRYTRLDNKEKVMSKYNQFRYENACVIFKDISYGQIQDQEGSHSQYTNNKTSLQYFLKKAILKAGLEICGMRMVYMEKEQQDIYEHLFNEKLKLEQEDSNQKSLLAFFLRGVDAISKLEGIIGHFNPEIARKTNEKSVRAFFGKDRDNNCVLKMFASQKKNLSELTFWFGGRVYAAQQAIPSTEVQNTMYVVLPPKVDKHFLFLSPLITQKDLNEVLQKLSDFGITILDIQKIDFNKLQYDNGSMQSFNRDMCFFKLRGNTYSLQVGYVLKLARENLKVQFQNVNKALNKYVLSKNTEYGSLLMMSQDNKEYRMLKSILNRSQFKVSYAKAEQEMLQQKKMRAMNTSDSEKTENYDSEDTQMYKDIQLYSGLFTNKQIKKSSATVSKAQSSKTQDPYQTSTFVCFLKISLLKKHLFGDILGLLLKQSGFELLGLKVVNAKREVFLEAVPNDIKVAFKSIAYKFYEHHQDLKLRKKLVEFKSLVLVLRGRNVEQTIDSIYDREKSIFSSELGFYETTPQVLFLTNRQILDYVLDFILSTKMIKLYNDFSMPHEHLMDSPVFSYMLTHNSEVVPSHLLGNYNSEGDVISVNNIVEIKQKELLVELQANDQLSASVCVIKPNQPFNMAIRTLKSIANNEQLGLQISDIQMVKYDENQLNLLYKHDIEYDEQISEQSKEKYQLQYKELFKKAKNPTIQILISGAYSITKLQQLIGNKDPRLASKDQLRSFYGVDRFDNAYFVSENFAESLIERDFLLKAPSIATESLLLSEGQARQIKSLISTGDSTSVSQLALQSQSSSERSQMLIQHAPELALILIAPKLVMNNDFVYILDDFYRQKFTICNMSRRTLEREELEFMFQDLAPRFFNMDYMWSEAFSKGPSMLLVVEKEKAVNEASELIGRFEIKQRTDFEKTKKKQSSLQMFNYGNEAQTLIQEYGSYIFSFPNANLNQKKIVKFFSELPNSQNFTIETTL